MPFPSQEDRARHPVFIQACSWVVSSSRISTTHTPGIPLPAACDEGEKKDDWVLEGQLNSLPTALSACAVFTGASAELNFFFFFFHFSAAPMAYGSSQARGQIRAASL